MGKIPTESAANALGYGLLQWGLVGWCLAPSGGQVSMPDACWEPVATRMDGWSVWLPPCLCSDGTCFQLLSVHARGSRRSRSLPVRALLVD